MSGRGVRNLLEMVPLRQRQWRREPTGGVVVLEPRFGASRPGLWLAGALSMADIEIRLDDFGSATWELSDGERDVGAVAAALRARFGSEVEPVDDRLAEFYKTLERTGFIAFAPEMGASEP